MSGADNAGWHILPKQKFHTKYSRKITGFICAFIDFKNLSIYFCVDGSLFWSWPKLRPRPVLFDPSDPIHAGSVSLNGTIHINYGNFDSI